jgi:hypothetical protein
MVKPKKGDWIITKPRWYRKEPFLTQVVDVDKDWAYYLDHSRSWVGGSATKCHVDFDRLTVITKEVADIMRAV